MVISVVEMSILGAIIDELVAVIEAIGYIGIFILMTLESAGVPIPSEIVVTFAGYLAAEGKMDFWMVVLISSFANLTGSIIFYYIGVYVGRPFIKRYGRYLLMDERHLAITEEWVRKYGNLAIFIGRVTPAVRTYISIVAGIGLMDLFPFIILTIIGSIIWNFMLAYIGFLLGEHWESILPYLDIIGIVAVIIGLVFIIYVLKYWGRR